MLLQLGKCDTAATGEAFENSAGNRLKKYRQRLLII